MNTLQNVNLGISQVVPPKRVAFCLRGSVSKICGGWGHDGSCKEYINYQAVANSVKDHILSLNNHMQIDVFMHSWSEDLKVDLDLIYRPVVSLFENNSLYYSEISSRCLRPKDFPGISHALSIKKVIEAKEKHESTMGFRYDIVVLYRPDVLIWKDMRLDDYDTSLGFHVNGHHGCNGDFHFVMSNDDACFFKGLYDSPLLGNHHAIHHWIKNYVVNFMCRPIIADSIAPGKHQEVARPNKLKKFALGRYRLNPTLLKKYGMTNKDLGI